MKHACGGDIEIYSDISGLWMKCNRCFVAELACPDDVFRRNIDRYKRTLTQKDIKKEPTK